MHRCRLPKQPNVVGNPHPHVSMPCKCTLSRCTCSMLARVAPRLVSFEEQVAAVREALAALHERQEDWAAAAQTLAGIDLDSGRAGLLASMPPCLSALAAAVSCGQWPVAGACSWSTPPLARHAADSPVHATAGLETLLALKRAQSCMPLTDRRNQMLRRCAAGGARVQAGEVREDFHAVLGGR